MFILREYLDFLECAGTLDRGIHMRYTRIVGSSAALFFGVGIVLMSLISAAQVQSKGLEASQKEMYFEAEMLPDHVLYPVFMTKDRVQLEFAQPKERIQLRLQYAERRMVSAQALVQKGKYDVALSTATKAQKYLLTAAYEAQQVDADAQTMKTILNKLQRHTEKLEEIQSHYSGDGYAVLQTLIDESRAYLQS